MKKILKKQFIVVLTIIMTLCLLGCEKTTQVVADGELIIHYIDVGQADSTLIQGKDFNILIDGGNKADGDDLINYLSSQGVDKIDIAIGTHAHEDHIGGFPEILESFACDTFYISNTVSSTKIYERLLDVLDETNVKVKVPEVGETLTLGDVNIKFFGPLRKYKDLNDSSIILKLSHGDNSYLFTGDAESGVEEELVKKWGNELQSTIYQAGHHGSSSSNSKQFIGKVKPKTVMISSNKEDVPHYGHPHFETLDLLNEKSIDVYRTDKQGTIIVKDDGKNYSINTKKEFSGDLYKK